MNYVKALPRDNGSAPMTDYPPPYPAQTTYQKENGAVSSVISLNPNTTCIEVGAFGGQGAVLKWITIGNTSGTAANQSASVVASGLQANFDHFVPAGVGIGNFRKFVVPKETQGSPNGQVGSVNGLYQRVAIINAGAVASSILVTEY